MRLLGHGLALISLVKAATVDVQWDVGYIMANPDGRHERRVIGVNGAWPPPPIEVSSKDTLRLHVHNSLDKPTSVHHHGMFFNGSSYNDGASGVSECGIPPGSSYTYEVPISTNGQWGTYWIHAHHSGQYVDGLKAPLIIHKSGGEAYHYDDEYTVLLSDWYHEEHGTLIKHFLSKANPTGAEPVPNTPLIYFSHKGTYLQGFNDQVQLSVTPSKTYRLRVINTSAFAMFLFWIDGHDMRVIEVDGTDVQEFPTKALSLAAGQRYSVLITTRPDRNNNFLMHANMDVTMFDDIPDDLIPSTTSNVVYSSDAPMHPATEIRPDFEFDDLQLSPLTPESLPHATWQITLILELETMDNGINRAMFNSTTYNHPLVPALLTQLTMGPDATNPAIYTPNSFVLEPNEVVELKVVNLDDNSHPFHLHGHKFAVAHRAQEWDSDDPELNPPLVEDQNNPVWRDTVQIPGGGSVTIRFVADNPGAWIFHCHIEWHLEAGLAVVFNESPLISQRTLSPPSSIGEHCVMLGLPSSGNAAGHHSIDDLSGLPVGPFRQVLGWNSKATAAVAGCVIMALLGMFNVGLYTFGGTGKGEENGDEAVDW